MYQRLTSFLLHWLRVPPEPHPPHGDPASLRVFRAGRNYLHLRLLKWGFAQVGALIGIIFWFGVFSDLDDKVEEQRTRRNEVKPAAAAPAAAPGSSPPAAPPRNKIEAVAAELAAEAKALAEAHGKTEPQDPATRRKRWRPIESFYAWEYAAAAFLARLPEGLVVLLWFLEMAGFVVYVLQLPVTFLLVRMDFEMRWYMVTDRSLRIRHGVWKVNESTMSFANIQQVVVSQGPLQRLLSLADVKVQSAGGGGGEKNEHGGSEDDMHLGLFHSVTNAPEIRDLILERLRRFRESGLGDPEEKTQPTIPDPASPAAAPDELLAAAQSLLDEARALRGALAGAPAEPAQSENQ